MGITELGEKLGISPSTIKKYEAEFSIQVRRNEAGHRVYGDHEIYIYELVMRMKTMGASIATIRKILIKEGIVGGHEPQKSDTIHVIDYNANKAEHEVVPEKRYSIQEVTQLTKALKEIQEGYIESLKGQITEKDHQIEALQRQIELQTEIIRDFKDLVKCGDHGEPVIDKKDIPLLEEAKLSVWTRLKTFFQKNTVK